MGIRKGALSCFYRNGEKQRQFLSTAEATSVRLKFFEFLFRRAEGYVCIASRSPSTSETFKHSFFEWPKQKNDMVEFIDLASRTKNVWFGVSLVEAPRFIKENCMPGSFLWADLDDANISDFEFPPSCIIKSSSIRRQAFWRLNRTLRPEQAEVLSRKVAYKVGADKSGWDMVQLLRVPFTMNYKYNPPELVEIESVNDDLYDPAFFDAIEIDDQQYVKEHSEEVPKLEDLPDAHDVIFKHFHALSATIFMHLYNEIPADDEDWSKLLWRLLNICFECGMSAKEALSIALTAKCNKYERDKRPVADLWKEVVKVEAKQKNFNIKTEVTRLSMPKLVDENEVELLGFIREYRDWAHESTDAIPIFHDLSCFILMSALMSHSLKLETSFGLIYMNLWGLIIGDSTLARKTTAMKMAMDMLYEIDESLILASDGSVEGLLTGLSNRPGRVSIFYKDEVTGLFDSMNRKDYLAGMPETLTMLYDVPKVLPRLLRKETITVHSPYFIFFGGGIRDRVYSLLSDEYVLSGFLPRFLVVSGSADVEHLRRTGPANGEQSRRIKILNRASELYYAFSKTAEVRIGNQSTEMPVTFDVRLTPKAWERFGDIEYKLVDTANNSHHRMLALPTFQRLAFSGLKMAVLVAASQNGPDEANRVLVDVNHINTAMWFIQEWGDHSIDMFTNAGQTNVERLIGKVYLAIQRKPGVTRSEIMQHQKLTSKEMKDVIQTLYDRGLIVVKEVGRGARLYPATQ